MTRNKLNEILTNILTENEGLLGYMLADTSLLPLNYKFYMIADLDVDIKKFDIIRTIDSTLHRLIEAGLDDYQIKVLTGLIRDFSEFVEDESVYIDLDYFLPLPILNIDAEVTPLEIYKNT